MSANGVEADIILLMSAEMRKGQTPNYGFISSDNEIALPWCLAHEFNNQSPPVSFGCCVIAETSSLERSAFSIRASEQVAVPWHVKPT